MPSGIEIASVVLGVAPLIIAGIELYKHGCASQELTQLSRVFKTHMVIYRNSLESMLTPLMSDKQVTELLKNPQHELWRSNDLSIKLKLHLGEESYKEFQDIQVDLQDMTARLHKAFATSERKGRGDIRHISKLAKSFVMRPRHRAGLARFRERVIQLETLREQRVSLVKCNWSRGSRGGRIKNWSKVRECALRLYDALSFKLKHCGCGTPHHCKLRLEARKAHDTGEHREGDDIRIQFGFFFSFVDDENDETVIESKNRSDEEDVALAWREIQIEVEPEKSPARGAEIESLCECLRSVQSTQPHNEHLGYIATTKGMRYVLIDANDQAELDAPTFSGIGLSPASTIKCATAQGKGLPPSDQNHLAFTLASSMLQLHDSPWLERWAERDIEYVRDDKRDATQSPIEPYMARRLSQGESHPPTPTPGKVSNLSLFVRNESLFTLAVLLIEIAYNTSIEDLAEPHEKSQADGMTWVAANRLCKQVKAYMGTQYQQAVAGCLYCDFPGGPRAEVKLDDEEVRHHFFEQVIVPLEESASRFT